MLKLMSACCCVYYRVVYSYESMLYVMLKTDHSFAGFNAVRDEIEDELERISSRAEYSPILLSWMLINYVTAAESTSLAKRCQQLGEKAIAHRVIKVISDIANDSVIQVISTFFRSKPH